jgi:hypothetical protein
VSGGAFTSAFEADDNKYAPHVRFGFEEPWLLPIPLLPSRSELVNILGIDLEEHERIWQLAADGPIPKVELNVMSSYGYIGRSQAVTFVVDTGAFSSTLKEETADLLNIDRTLQRGESPGFGHGAGGQRIVGVHRWISVQLGGVWQEVPVLVPPEREVLEQRELDGLPVGLPPKNDLLGRAQILGNYLLCLDQDSLYAFRDMFSRRQRYTSRALAKFRGQ